MRRIIIALALLLMLPSLSAAGGRGGHAGVRSGGVAGLRGEVPAGFLRPVGIRGFGYPGFFNRSAMPGGTVTPLTDSARIIRTPAPNAVSPPLIIERHGDGYERLAQTNQPVTGPLVLERQGDTFERIR